MAQFEGVEPLMLSYVIEQMQWIYAAMGDMPVRVVLDGNEKAAFTVRYCLSHAIPHCLKVIA